jgi:site-specific DNA-adenine methylase
MGEQYFYQINDQDLFILLYSELEKFELKIYKNKLREKINRPEEDFKKIAFVLFSNFGYNGTLQYKSMDAVSHLLTSLENQISKRNKVYPPYSKFLSQVRFNQKELERVFLVAQELILKFLEPRKLMQDAYIEYELHE